MASGASRAQSADDIRWIAQCVRDNAAERASDAVKLAYCTCMVSQMSDAENRSVSQWERANPAVARMCAARAGWN